MWPEGWQEDVINAKPTGNSRKSQALYLATAACVLAIIGLGIVRTLSNPITVYEAAPAFGEGPSVALTDSSGEPSDAYSIEVSSRTEGTGEASWSNEIEVDIGQWFEIRVAFNNNGSTVLNNVIVLSQLAAESGPWLEMRNVQLFSANNPDGRQYQGGVQTSATSRQVNVDIGSYTPSSNAFLTYEARFASELTADGLATCGRWKFNIYGYATPNSLSGVNDGTEVILNFPIGCDE